MIREADKKRQTTAGSRCGCGCCSQFVQLVLLLLKLKAWRFVFILVAGALCVSNLYHLPKVAEGGARRKGKTNVPDNDRLALYSASDFVASGVKVLVDRAAFPKEVAAASAILASGDGWIADCSPEADCREQLIHSTGESVVAAIRYSESPEQARAVLECPIRKKQKRASMECGFLYATMALSMQAKSSSDKFKDMTLFEMRNGALTGDEQKEDLGQLANLTDSDALKTLPDSECSSWVRSRKFNRVVSAAAPAILGLAVLGLSFYLLISTLSCIRKLKADGFLQQQFRSGLSVSAYWLAVWLIALVECALLAGAFTMSHALQCPGVLSSDSTTILFFFFLLLSLNLTNFFLLMEILVPSMLVLSILAIASSVVHFVSFMIGLRSSYPEMHFYLPSLFSAEFYIGCFGNEVNSIYSTAETDSKSEKGVRDRLSAILVGFIAADLVLALLVIYIDFLIPSGNGLCLPPYYPFSRSFWLPSGIQNNESAGAAAEESNRDQSHIEPVVGLKPIVAVKEVTKAYSCFWFCRNNNPPVLKQLSCTIYRGQITALIGHNGAGKSTLIKVLTGQELPNSGSATIAGCVATNPLLSLALRGRIGICPQFDILCNSLTVLECIRLALVSRAHGDLSQLQKARGMLKRLGLGDKENALSYNLSGGQKRKLSTILALLGRPEVVFLDEPTSGLDPVSRRQLWQLLQEEKSSCSIILCTQFMDEADILADRKIFLCGGRIVCAGSSMFLKRAFGCCFILNVSLKSKSGVQSVLARLKQVHVKSQDDTELQLEVPTLNPAVLIDAVQILENSNEIDAFGLSQASLDEIFMRLSGRDSAEVIAAFQSGALVLSKLPEKAEEPIVKELQENRRKHVNIDKGLFKQFAALFYVNIIRQVRVRSKLQSRFLIPALLLALIGLISSKLKLELAGSTTDPEMAKMGISISPQRLRSETFGSGDLAVACISDGADNPVSVELCKKLNLTSDTTTPPREPFVIEKSPSESIEQFLSKKETSEALMSELRAQGWIPLEYERTRRTPCVLYYASPWLVHSHNKNRSISIGIFLHPMSSSETAHIYRRAMTKLFLLFLIADVETTTALSLFHRISVEDVIDTGLQLYFFYLVFCLLAISYLSDPIEDLTSRVRSYLISTGMSRLAYWVNTFIMHWLQYALCYIASVSLLCIAPAYRHSYLILAAFLPVFVFGLASNLLSVYALAVATKTKSTIVSVGCVFIAVVLPIAISELSSKPAFYLIIAVWLFPPMAPSALMHSCVIYYFYKRDYYQRNIFLPGMAESLWKRDAIFHSLLAMPVHIIILICVITLLERGDAIAVAVWKRGDEANKSENINSDVEEGAGKEARRVLDAPRNAKNILEVRQLAKTYSNGVRAVRNVTFGTMVGEIFGLLGANGAGKSTTMSVIVGEEAATEGVCEVQMYNGAWLSGQEGASEGAIGFCPQHNPLFDSITVAEHIMLYADIRGLDSVEADRESIVLMRSLGLEQHSGKRAGQLSGGNKRRLCLAIALLGDPALVVIDEASTGVDPENKRFIWAAIRRLMHKRRSIMVTTHSMEEVEALCTRVGIMNNGRMICCGTVQQLRSLHGDAYTLEMLMQPDAEVAIKQKMQLARASVTSRFNGAHTQEDLGLGLVMQFTVPKAAVPKLSEALIWLAANQSKLGVSYWAFYQMSLDQVFVKLVKMYDSPVQRPATGKTGAGV